MIRAVPGSQKTCVVGRYGDSWKVRVRAAPEKGKANDELCAYLSSVLGISRSDVSVVFGTASRDKTVLIAGLSMDEIVDALTAAT